MQKNSQRNSGGGIALGECARSAKHLSGGRLRLRNSHSAARHFEQGAENGRNGFEGTLARHGENVRQRRESGWIFALIKSIPSQLRRHLRPSPKPCTPAILRACL